MPVCTKARGTRALLASRVQACISVLRAVGLHTQKLLLFRFMHLDLVTALGTSAHISGIVTPLARLQPSYLHVLRLWK